MSNAELLLKSEMQKSLVCSRRILCKDRASKELSEVDLKIWRKHSGGTATTLRFITYFYENSSLGALISVHGFDDMDALAKCIREIDMFILIHLRQYEMTFETGLPITLENGSAFFCETTGNMGKIIQNQEP